MRLESEWLSLATNMATSLILIYLIKSAKEIIIRWLDIQQFRQDSDLLGPTEIRYHGGRLRPVRPIPLTTLHVPSAEDHTTQRQEVFTGWNSVLEKLRGVGRARETA